MEIIPNEKMYIATLDYGRDSRGDKRIVLHVYAVIGDELGVYTRLLLCYLPPVNRCVSAVRDIKIDIGIDVVLVDIPPGTVLKQNLTIAEWTKIPMYKTRRKKC